MAPRSESNVVIDIVSEIAPWVWPATAAILVGGLVVVSSLIGAIRQPPPETVDAVRHISAADRATTNMEIPNDARAN